MAAGFERVQWNVERRSNMAGRKFRIFTHINDLKGLSPGNQPLHFGGLKVKTFHICWLCFGFHNFPNARYSGFMNAASPA